MLTPLGFEVIDKNGSLTSFPFDPNLISNTDVFSDGEFVYFLPEDPHWNPYYMLDKEGHIQPSDHYRFEWYDPILYNSNSLRDATGQIVLTTDYYLWHLGDVVLAYSMDYEKHGSQPLASRSVYAMDGSMLLDNVYGFADTIAGPDGGVFVYLNPETCVLLYPDGRTIPVPDAPTVESVDWWE